MGGMDGTSLPERQLVIYQLFQRTPQPAPCSFPSLAFFLPYFPQFFSIRLNSSLSFFILLCSYPSLSSLLFPLSIPSPCPMLDAPNSYLSLCCELRSLLVYHVLDGLFPEHLHRLLLSIVVSDCLSVVPAVRIFVLVLTVMRGGSKGVGRSEVIVGVVSKDERSENSERSARNKRRDE